MLNLEQNRTYSRTNDTMGNSMNQSSKISILKREGHKEPLDLEKMHKVVFHACENLKNVSASQVEINSHLSFFDGMTSSEIQETLIKSAADLITEDTPNYQYVGGRLINYHLRKMVYDSFDPPHILDIVKQNVEQKYYDKNLLEDYTEEEWSKFMANCFDQNVDEVTQSTKATDVSEIESKVEGVDSADIEVT